MSSRASLDDRNDRNPPQDLAALCRAVSKKYAASRDRRDLDVAIRLVRLALQSAYTPRDAIPDLQYELASLLSSKHENTNNVQDLRAAVEAFRQSTSALQRQDPRHGPRVNRYLHVLQQLTLEVHDVLELDTTLQQHFSELDSLLRHSGMIHSSSQNPLHVWTRTNAQLVTHCLSRRYEITGTAIHLCELILHAMKWWNGSADPAKPHYQEPTREESRMFPWLIDKVARLAGASENDSIVVQITNAFHREYLSRVSRLGPRRSLAEVARDVKINAEIVIVQTPNSDPEACRKKALERFHFAQSIGATTCQARWNMIVPVEDNEHRQDIRSPESGKVVPSEMQAAELTNVQRLDGPSSEENSEGNKGPKQTESQDSELYTGMRASVTGLLHRSAQLWASYLRGRLFHDLEQATNLARQAVVESASDEFSQISLLSVAPSPSGRDFREVQFDLILHSKARFTLGVCLKALYQHHGEVDHLKTALDEMQEAYKTALKIPFGKHPDLKVIVSRLGLLLRLRFLRFGSLNDLDLAVQRMRSTLNYPGEPCDQRQATELLTNYALILRTRFDRTQKCEDIDECISVNKEALSMLSSEDEIYAGLLSALSTACLMRFSVFSDVSDLEEADRFAKQAMPILLANPEVNVVALNDISWVFRSVVSCQQRRSSLSVSIIEEAMSNAVQCAEEALKYLTEESMVRSHALLNLGLVRLAQYRYQPSVEILNLCLEVFQVAWNSQFQDTSSKLTAGRYAAILLWLAKERTEAATVLEDVTEFVASAAPRWLPNEDRLETISEFAGIASDAAVMRLLSDSAATVDTTYKALRSLELGRGIILGSTLDYRMAYRSLTFVSRVLAEEFVTLSSQLDALPKFTVESKIEAHRRKLKERLSDIMGQIRKILGSKDLMPPIPPGSWHAYSLQQIAPAIYGAYEKVQRELNVLPEEGHLDELSNRRQMLATEFEGLLSKIRGRNELRDFLRPLSLERTVQLAGEGNLVVVVVGTITKTSLAIIVNRAGLSVVHLPDLDAEDAEDRMAAFRSATTAWTLRTSADNNRKMTDFLQWLWETAVKPILDELGCSNRVDAKPRVHWIGAGLLAGAPFHAAGTFSSSWKAGKCTMDLVISSYTPTLRTLAYTLENNEQTCYEDTVDRLLIVSAPQVPGTESLPLISREVANIEAIAKTAAQTVLLNNSTPSQVMSELPLATFVHFACHGHSDANDIESSYLVLNQDNVIESLGEGYPTDLGKLSVRQIQASKPPTARLAYLSACSGAEGKSPMLADETIHLASAFQLAGFEHVIATMWQTKDSACQAIAEEFYKNLFESRSGSKSTVEAHLALHNAVQKLRQENPGKPLIWAPFVHYGG